MNPESKDVTRQAADRSVAGTRGERGADAKQEPREVFLRPATDIFEDDAQITLVADMPGVSRERLNVQVDHDTLLLEGAIDVPGAVELQALHADVRAGSYRRSFVLSQELDAERIEATLKDGVLQVRIPKRAELRARRIAVQAN
jgi:HSP20 family molecular chaperone IbpA